MFLERPVSEDVLHEHVVRLVVSSGRLPRQLSPTHELFGSVRDDAHLGNERACPQVVDYGISAQVASLSEVIGREPRERLRYVSGWFRRDPACEYQELAEPRE
jgi:hypothetical protein